MADCTEASGDGEGGYTRSSDREVVVMHDSERIRTVRLSPKKTKFFARTEFIEKYWQHTEILEIKKTSEGGLFIRLSNDEWTTKGKLRGEVNYIRLDAKQAAKLRRLLE